MLVDITQTWLENYPATVYKRYPNTQWLNYFYGLFMILVVGGIYALAVIEGFEVSDQMDSAVKIRVYGEVETNFTESDFEDFVTPQQRLIYNGLWDPAFYAMDMGNDEVFIVTNFAGEPDQTIRTCAEDPSYLESSVCNPNFPVHCVKDYYSDRNIKHGRYTGNCVKSAYKYPNGTSIYTCEVKTWCPVVSRTMFPLKNNVAALGGVVNSTIIISSSVKFTKFENAAWKNNVTDISECRKDGIACPVYDLKTIIRESKSKDSEEMILRSGALLTVNINYDCFVNFECLPTYKHWDVPNPYPHNMTYKYLVIWNGNNERALYKAYGVRLRIVVTGQAKVLRLYLVISRFFMYTGNLSNVTALFACFVSLVYPKRNKNNDEFERLVEDVPEPNSKVLEFASACKGGPLCFVLTAFLFLGIGGVVSVPVLMYLVSLIDHSALGPLYGIITGAVIWSGICIFTATSCVHKTRSQSSERTKLVEQPGTSSSPVDESNVEQT